MAAIAYNTPRPYRKKYTYRGTEAVRNTAAQSAAQRVVRAQAVYPLIRPGLPQPVS